MEKNRVMMIIIIVLLMVLLGTIAFVSIYAVNMLTNNEAIEGQRPVQYAVKLTREEITRVPAVPITVKANLTPGLDGSTAHASKIDIQVEVNNNINDKKLKKDSDKLIEQLTADELVIKSTALKILKNKTFEEMSRSDSIAILEDEIARVLMEEYSTNLIIGILISDLINQ